MVGLLFGGVWPHHASRDLEPGHGRPLRYVGAPQPTMASSTDRFPMCYGPEFAAVAVKEWLGNLGVHTAFIEPGSPWENGYVESCNSKLRDELLDGEIFYSLKEAQILIEAWRRHYNVVRPHSALGWQPPAPEVSIIAAAVWPHQGQSIAMATNAGPDPWN